MVEHPAIDVAAAIADLLARRRPLAVVRDRVLALPDAVIERVRVVAQAALDERRIAQADGDEDVEPRAALDEQPRHVRRVADEVLRRRRLVIHVARVDVGAAVDQVLRDLDGARAVQRRLAVAAAGVDQRRIAIDELPQPIEHAEVRRGEDVDDRASRDERRRLLGRASRFQQPEPAGPPGALEVEVGAVREQHVEHRQVLRRARDRPAVEMADRRVHGGAHLRVLPRAARGHGRRRRACSAMRNRSTGVLVSESILRFIAAQLSKP